jgi:hypothetical protein
MKCEWPRLPAVLLYSREHAYSVGLVSLPWSHSLIAARPLVGISWHCAPFETGLSTSRLRMQCNAMQCIPTIGKRSTAYSRL